MSSKFGVLNLFCVFSISMTLISSCGNPHLIEKRKSTNSVKPKPTSPTDNTNTKPVTLEKNLKLEILIDGNKTNSYSFGKKLVSEINKVTVKVVNVGNIAAELNQASMQSSVFSLQDQKNCLAKIGVQESCELILEFPNAKIGSYEGQFSFFYNGQEKMDQTTVELKVSGEKVKPNPTGILSLSWSFDDLDPSAEVVDFGKSRIEDAVSVYGLVTNLGTTSAILDEKSLEQVDSKIFTIVDYKSCLDAIKPNASCSFKVTFNSIKNLTSDRNEEVYKAKAVLSYKDLTENLSEILSADIIGRKVVGITTQPSIDFSQFDGSDLDFGSVAVGSTYSKLLEVKNNNRDGLVVPIDEMHILGSFDSFSFTGGVFPGERGTCSRLIVKGSCLLDLSFSPNSIGKAQAKLELKYSDKLALSSNLKGTGIESNGTCENTQDSLVLAEGDFPYNDPSIIYPYKTHLDSRGVNKKPNLTIKYGIAATQDCRDKATGANCSYVKDGMILTRFQMPSFDDSRELVDAKLQVDVMKTNDSDEHMTTELLCMQNSVDRLCSGRIFDKLKPGNTIDWLALRNPKFFTDSKNPTNLVFTRELMRDQNRRGDRWYMVQSFSIASLYGNDNGPMNLLNIEKILRDSYLNIIMVDDVKNLDYPRLLVTFKKDVTCVQNNANPNENLEKQE